MTRKQFVDKAVRDAERTLQIPAGWWGTWRDLHSTKGMRIRLSGYNCWTIRDRSGKIVSQHDSRASAIRKAASL